MSAAAGPTTSDPFQNPNAACCLNDAIAHIMPLYMKCGEPHFMSSSVGTDGMHLLADPVEDRLRELGCLCDVGLDAGISLAHGERF
jgi:hypothetical protein